MVVDGGVNKNEYTQHDQLRFPMVKMARKTTTRNGFGPVSRINSAPVAVGNSIRGTKPKVTQSANGARIVGRDFAFALGGTVAAATDWEVIGGMPITPCALPCTVLRNYCQMYANFKVNSITAHYITSSPTSQAGDVMFYFEPKRFSPFPDYTNASFLPFVLSDSNTVIGPQWTNHTALIEPVKEWKSTAYGNSTDLDEECAGSLYCFSKTNAANSPGYVLLDYDISFKNLALNPRLGVLPVTRAQNTYMCLTAPAATTSGNAATFTATSGKTVAGTTSALPSGALTGDIYKIVLQITNSTVTGTNAAWSAGTTTPTVSNLLRYNDDTAITLDDGHTFYANLVNATDFKLFSTIDQARSNSNAIEWGVTNAASTVVNVCCTASLVTNIDDFQESSYPG